MAICTTFQTRAEKIKHLFKGMWSVVGVLWSSIGRRDFRNNEEDLHEGTRNNTVRNPTVQRSRQEATFLRNEALKKAKNIRKTLQLLSLDMKLTSHKDDLGNTIPSNCEGSSVAEVICALEKELEDVNRAIRTLNFYLVQSAEDSLATSKFPPNDEKCSVQS